MLRPSGCSGFARHGTLEACSVVLGPHLEMPIHMGIQELVRRHRKKWIAIEQWEEPDLADCLDFMATEVAEAIDKRLRLSSSYVRNADEPKPTPEQIGVEIFDAIMMGCVALDLLGLDLDTIAEDKLMLMDAKRGL